MKPVLYLDVDDTLLSMHRSYEVALKAEQGRYWGFAPPGAREFLLWALEHFEVRWLTWWCAWGDMHEVQQFRLEAELHLPPGTLADVRSAVFGHSEGCHKTEGIAWDEHEAGRPFWWVEDWISEREQQVLRGRGMLDRWIPCHVTEDPHALSKAWRQLREAMNEARAA